MNNFNKALEDYRKDIVNKQDEIMENMALQLLVKYGYPNKIVRFYQPIESGTRSGFMLDGVKLCWVDVVYEKFEVKFNVFGEIK